MEEAKKTKKNRDDRIGFGGIVALEQPPDFNDYVCIAIRIFDDLLYRYVKNSGSDGKYDPCGK